MLSVAAITGCDVTAPNISIDAPADGSTVTTATPAIVLSFSDDAEGTGINANSLTVTVDGAKQDVDCVPNEGGADCTVDDPLEAGSHTIEASILDNSGNRGTDASTFEVEIAEGSDGTPPMISPVAPENFSTTDSTPTLIIGFIDESTGTGVDTTTFSLLLDGVDITGDCTLTATQATCTTASLASGEHTINVAISDNAGNEGTLEYTFTVVLTLSVEITEPDTDLLTDDDSFRIAGQVDGNVESVLINSRVATLTGNTFNLEIPLREGINTITAVATGPQGEAGSDSVRVIRDTTAPTVVIDGPANNLLTASSTIAVTGMVSDVVAGPINNDNCSVRIRGRDGFYDADIENGTFVAEGVRLLPGANSISAIAFDALGNESTSFTVTVTRREAPGQRLEIMAGDNQLGVAGEGLPQPIIVKASDAMGNGIPGRQITFDVIKNNGKLDGTESTKTVTTDANGEAEIGWSLGNRAGRANNRIEVSSPGFSKMLVCASAQSADCAMLVPDGGNYQSGIAGQPLAQPFVVAALDEGGNRCAGQVIRFTSMEGGGTFDGDGSVDVTTGASGFATATLTLGMEPGNNNHVVAVSVPGGQVQVTFLASAEASDLNTETAFVGTVLDTTNAPIVGAAVFIHDFEDNQTLTDEIGSFRLTGVPTGNHLLVVDGSLVGNEGDPGEPPLDETTYPFLDLVVDILPNVENSLGRPIFLPTLDPSSIRTLSTINDTVIPMGGVNGLELKIFAGSATFPSGLTSGQMSVTQVSNDQVPMPPNGGAAPPWVGTFQPAGVHFDPPVQISAPNSLGLAVGSIVDLFSFDHNLGMYINVGTGTVQPDGSRIISDPGSGIRVSGWFFDCPPPPPSGEANNNDDPLQDDTVKDQFKDAWNDSNPGPNPDPNRQEHGGWIVRNPDGSFSVERWPMGEAAGITPTPKPANAVAAFHTHPNTGPNWKHQHSDPDKGWSNGPNGVRPFYAISDMRIYRLNPDGTEDDVGPRDPC